MKKPLLVTVLCTLMCHMSVFSQIEAIRKADAQFDSRAYASAIKGYEKIIERGFTSPEMYMKLGDANFAQGHYGKASQWYAKLFGDEAIWGDTEYLYKYALTLKSEGKYDLSDAKMKELEAKNSDDSRLTRYFENPDYRSKIKRNAYSYTLKNLSTNSAASDFAPSIYKQSLVFSSARDTGLLVNKVYEWNNKAFLDLFSGTLQDNGDYGGLSKFSKELNSKTHESSIVFSKDGNTAYFTRNNSKNGNFYPDKNGLSKLKIYRATLIEGKWTNIEDLPFNSDAYSTAHPSLNIEENKLYFASDMAPSFGASDIFEVAIYKDGSFGTPKNLGTRINTEGRETFPFVSDRGTLYFASDGHPGLGGLDIFKTNQSDWDQIDNMGEGINGMHDDFSLIIDETENRGYFASNRPGGKGSDDLYSFKRD